MIYLALPVGRFHGWGICGKYIARELSALEPVRLITDPFDASSVSEELDEYFLRHLRAGDGLPELGAFPLLQCVTGANFLPFRPGLRGKFTAGYSFFEDNLLCGRYLQNAREHYDMVITGSTWCTEVLRGYGLESVETVIQGVDPTLFYPREDRDYFRDRFVVFSGGKFELRKGQDLVIRAYKVLQDRHPDVLLVNSWFNIWHASLNTMAASPYIKFNAVARDHATVVGQTLANNGIDLDRVVTLPARPNALMPRVYWNSDVGLFPNRCEGGTNLVLMEYMACGKPAIATYGTGQKDVLSDANSIPLRTMKEMTVNNNGVPMATWDDPDLDEIVEKLEWAYENRDKLRVLGARAGEDMRQLGWKQTARRFQELLTRG